MRWRRWTVLLLCLPLLAAIHPAAAVQPARMLEAVSSPSWTLTVRSVERRPDPLTTGNETSRPAGQWAIFTITLENRSTAPRTPRASDYALRSATGVIAVNQASASAARTFARDGGYAPFGDEIPAGSTAATLLVFDISADAFPLTLTFIPAHRDIKIDECSCSLPAPGGRT